MSENAQSVEKRKPAARALVNHYVCGHRRSEARSLAYQRRRTMQVVAAYEAGRYGKKDRVTFCGRRLQKSGIVAISTHLTDEERRASFYGVAQCGDVWRCPTCSTIIKGRRADEIQQGAKAWREKGGHLGLLTVTVRHHRGDDLGKVYEAMSEAWRYMTSTRAYKAMRRRFGLEGYVRSTEITYGANGWHPHWHFLLFIDRALADDEVARAQAEMLSLWQRAVEKFGGKLPNEHGLRLDLVDYGDDAVADYLTKMRGGEAGAALEVAGGMNKAVRDGGSVTPFQLLDVIAAGGDDAAQARALWLSYCDAMKGKRSVYWTRGLRKTVGLGLELTDEEIVAESDRGRVEVVMDGRMHDGLRLAGRAHIALDLAERQAWDELGALCKADVVVRFRRPDGSAVQVLACQGDDVDRLATLAAAAEAAQAERDAVPLLNQWERDGYRRVGAEMGLCFGEIVPSRPTVKGDQ